MASLQNVVNCCIFCYNKNKEMPGKLEDRWSEGIWLGCDVRSGEHLIGMESGVFRVSTVRLKTSDTRWSPDRVMNLTGTPAQPVPGQSYNRSPAFTRKYGQAPQAHAEYAPQNVEPVTIRSWKYTKAISLSMVLLQDVQDARLFSPTRHLNHTQ